MSTRECLTNAHPETPADRLDRLRHWAVTGRRRAAALELSAWARDPGFPAAARLLWSGLLQQRGELEAALEALQPRDAEADTPALRSMRVAILVRLGRLDRASHLARRAAPTLQADLAAPCAAAGSGSGSYASRARISDSERPLFDGLAVATALHGRLALVPSLVAAERARPRSGRAMRLREGLIRLHEAEVEACRMTWRVPLAAGIAHLSVVLGDEEAARDWAHRGLRLEPTNAELAMILSWLSDDPSVGEPAVEVLRRVAQKHPDYPDIRTALDRRLVRDGSARPAAA